jgi:tetratricopeptide (TPR) repeat protein
LTVRRLNLLFWLFSASAGGLGSNEEDKLQQAKILPHIEKQFAKLQNSDLELEYRAHFIHRMNVVDFSVLSEQYRQVLRGVERSSRSVLERVGLLNYLLKYSISRELLADEVKRSSDRVIASLLTELLNDADTQDRTKVEALQELMLVWVQPDAVRLGQVERASRLIEGVGNERQRALAWVRTGQLYQRLDQNERAIGALDRAVALVGALKTDEDLIALVEVLGQLDQDEKILKIAEQTGNSRVLEKLAEIYASKGRVEEAIGLRRRVAEPDIKISMIQNLIVYHRMTGLSVFSAEELEALSLEAIGLVNGAASGGQEFSVPIELPWASRVRLVNSFSSLEQRYAQYVRLQPTSAGEEEEQWQGVMRLWARVTPETRDANLYYVLDNAVNDSNPDRLERVLAQIEDPAQKAGAMIDAIWLLEILIRNQRAFEGY